MGDTSIEWATKTWNPLRGCSKVSEGCKNCYAIRVAHRFGGEGLPYEGLTAKGPGGPNWTGKIRTVPDALDEPLKWRQPQRVFVNSMSDLFHPEVPFDFIDQVFAVMALAKHHTFMILTKRPERMLTWFNRDPADLSDELYAFRNKRWPLPNVWLGTSVENQKAADERIPLLLQTPAAIRFLSCEPLLGPVNIPEVFMRKLDWGEGPRHWPDGAGEIDWVIVGGESGPGARPMHPDWARSLRDQCQAAGVPFFFKQHGEWAPYVDEDKFTHCGADTAKNMQHYVNLDGSTGQCWLVDGDGTWQNWTGEPEETCAVVNRVGKKSAGRLLDGREWSEFPDVSE